MTDNIDLMKIWKKWQDKWSESQIYKVSEWWNKPKYYALDMFPYPSWAGLHVGHPKGFVATDVVSRKKILEGYNVLHPMGFDAFGLPAEQYAIKNKMHPSIATAENVKRYTEQLEQFGFTYDWDRQVNTTDPEFYKWTQWIFIQLYNHYFDEKEQKAKPISDLEAKWFDKEYIDSQRLAFVDERPIIWCPSCKTWLANEDLEGGRCERCDTEIERKYMKQWVLRITKYADRMLQWLQELPGWASHIKELQKNWIGKSQWTQFKMKIDGTDLWFEVFTTRVDTVFGMSFVAMAPEHPLVEQITTDECKQAVQEYVKQSNAKTDMQRTELAKDKTWVFCWAYAINPFNGEKVAIYVADYVLYNYGTWVVMAVPAHDERDYEFAKKYWIEVKTVISPEIWETRENEENRKWIIAILKNPKDGKFVNICWGEALWWNLFVWGWIEWDEDPLETAIREIKEETWYVNFKLVSSTEKIYCHYRAHSKNVNRNMQTYGFLFELIDEEKVSQNLEENEKWLFSVEWVDEKTVEDKVKEPTHKYIYNKLVKDIIYTDDGKLFDSWEFSWMGSAQARDKMSDWLESNGIGFKQTNFKIQDWVFSRQRYWWEPIPVIHCEKCGIVTLDESELPLTLPEVEHYEPTGTAEWPLAAIHDWINVDCPKCGWKGKRESNTMPQWAGSSWYWIRYMDAKNPDELVNKDKEAYWGQVDYYVWWAEHATRHLIYARFWHKFLYDIGVVTTSEPFKKLMNVWMVLAEDGRKMSKRWWNVINPDDVIAEFGADAFRTYEMFMWPFSQEIAWSTTWVKWVKKFLEKVIKIYSMIDENHQDNEKILSTLHNTIKKVTEDIDDFKFNTAISQMMIFANEIIDTWVISKDSFTKFVILLAPFAPHLTEEIWERMGNEYSIFTKAQWPSYDEKHLKVSSYELAVQINGKMRWTLTVPAESSQDEILEMIKADTKLNAYIQSWIRKTIFVKGKIINYIV